MLDLVPAVKQNYWLLNDLAVNELVLDFAVIFVLIAVLLARRRRFWLARLLGMYYLIYAILSLQGHYEGEEFGLKHWCPYTFGESLHGAPTATRLLFMTPYYLDRRSFHPAQYNEPRVNVTVKIVGGEFSDRSE